MTLSFSLFSFKFVPNRLIIEDKGSICLDNNNEGQFGLPSGLSVQRSWEYCQEKRSELGILIESLVCALK